ncbi:RNA polymerase sigma factor [Pseudoalteromonas sp. T1lg65]|uniref:RNA polymerase sigma factor n=1 Tax=Pseudoalteromonas sp. T1lg65 TaxID=2077101 RepID=UPI003F7ABFD7
MFLFTEKQLIKQAAQGNERAWQKLLEKHQQRIYNQCLRLIGNPSDAWDVCQDVFLSIYKSLPSYKGDAQFSTWVFRITHARIVDYMRKHRFEDVNDSGVELSTSGPDCEIAVLQQNAEIYHALKRLPFEQRLVVELKFFQQYTFDEIAAQLETPVNTVKARLYSALGKMKGQLEVNNG